MSGTPRAVGLDRLTERVERHTRRLREPFGHLQTAAAALRQRDRGLRHAHPRRELELRLRAAPQVIGERAEAIATIHSKFYYMNLPVSVKRVREV